MSLQRAEYGFCKEGDKKKIMKAAAHLLELMDKGECSDYQMPEMQEMDNLVKNLKVTKE